MLYKDVNGIIASFLVRPGKLRHWVPERWIRADIMGLNTNPAAVPYLAQHPELIRWKWLSMNPNAMSLLVPNIQRVDWSALSENASAVTLLRANPDKIDWYRLCTNSADAAIDMLEQNPKRIVADKLAYNRNPRACAILEFRLRFLNNLCAVSENPVMIPLLERHPHLIDWTAIAENPSAMHIIERELDRIPPVGWMMLSYNPGAERILRAHPDRISWMSLSRNAADWAVDMLLANPERRYVRNMWLNQNRRVLPLLQDNVWRGQYGTIGIGRNPILFESRDEYRAQVATITHMLGRW